MNTLLFIFNTLILICLPFVIFALFMCGLMRYFGASNWVSEKERYNIYLSKMKAESEYYRRQNKSNGNAVYKISVKPEIIAEYNNYINQIKNESL